MKLDIVGKNNREKIWLQDTLKKKKILVNVLVIF